MAIRRDWGDEGKGKIVDWLSERAEVIVRFQGGHNAGHTLVVDGTSFKLSLLPSGVVRPGKLSIIGNGVVVDPHALVAEIDRLGEQGVVVTPETLRVADNAPVILSLHRELDAIREKAAAKVGAAIGTTQRGIGPAYEDKVGRRAIRILDLAALDDVPAKVDRLLTHHNALRTGLGEAPIEAATIIAELEEVAPRIVPLIEPVWRLMEQQRRAGKRILFEGAQGGLLDIDHGTYPYVTSSHTTAGQAAAGSGIGPGSLGYILGITKAYTTRVGEGPFPAEQDNDVGEMLGTRGAEFGTVTGRKRRCGWFDAVLVRQMVEIMGIDGIALTKLDVLDGFEKIQICVAYRLDGRQLNYLPASPADQARVEPVFETLEGWQETTRGARRWADLPAEAVKYVRHVEELIGAPVSLLSTSPERDDTILVQDPFEDR